jgi:molybdopterin-guanine dinucleotide biosynthesis protein A
MGRDKAWLVLDGRPMIEHVIGGLSPATDGVAVIANDPEYQRLGLPVFADTNSGVGPLEAIRTALANSQTERILLVGCDMPFVTPDLFASLLEIGEGHQAAAPIGPDGLLEPLCAVYSTGILDVVVALIQGGERKVSRLLETIDTRRIAFDEIRDLAGSEAFFLNVNTPEDYERATALLKKQL